MAIVNKKHSILLSGFTLLILNGLIIINPHYFSALIFHYWLWVYISIE